jgi:hypothetical protein
MYETPLAQYDHGEQCWKTSEATSLWALPMSSLTLPAWGYLHDGALYELLTPERPTIEHAFSSLPTPTGDDANNVTRASGSFQSLTRTVVMLPTPINSDYNTPASEWMESHDRLQLRDIKALLPTPAVNDMGAGKDPQAWDEWAARQKAADGRPAPHGKSLEQEALKMLPTPSAQEPGYTGPLVDKQGKAVTHAAQRCYDPETGRLAQTGVLQAVQLLGATTHQPSTAGSTSSDDAHQAPLFNEQGATA